MKNLDKIIKYLKAYQHHCYLQSCRQPCKPTAEDYRERFKDMDKILKDLESGIL